MRATYHVVNPETLYTYIWHHFGGAKQQAMEFSKMYHRAIEVKRFPVPYKEQKLFLVIPK